MGEKNQTKRERNNCYAVLMLEVDVCLSLEKHPCLVGWVDSQLLEQPAAIVRTKGLGPSDGIGSNVKIIWGFCILPVDSLFKCYKEAVGGHNCKKCNN